MTVEEKRERERRYLRRRWALCSLGMTVLPLAVAFVCLHFGRSNTDLSTSLTVPLPLAIGLIALWQCPISLLSKLLGSLLYLFVAGAVLFLMAISYVCSAYGACM